MQVITVDDQIAPLLTGTLPGGTANGCYIDNSTPPASVPTFASLNVGQYYTDNCGGTLSVELTGTSVSGDNTGWTVTYTFSVADVCGNILGGQTITYTGSNQEVPTITCPTSAFSFNADQGACSASLTATDLALIATSGCAGSTSAPAFVYSINNQAISFPYDFPVGTTEVSVVATVDGQRSLPCIITVVVADNQDPLITACPVDVEVSCEAGLPVAITTADGLGATDNCGIESVTHADVRTDGACDNSYTITRTYTVTDVNGNTTTCVQVITVTDNIDPEIVSGPGATTVSCASAVPVADIALVTATDNCGDVTISFIGDVLSNQSCANRYTITRTYRATDECGNTTDHVQVITVDDQIAPTGTPPTGPSNFNACYVDDQTLPAGVSTWAQVKEIVENGFTDNCSDVTATQVGIAIISGDNTAWTVTYTYTISDACDNVTSQYTYVINGSNQNAITLTNCASDYITLNNGNCDGAEHTLTKPTVGGLCAGQTGEFTITIVDENGHPISYNDNGSTITAIFPLGTSTVTWTYTAGESISQSCTTKVTVNDGYLLVNYWFTNASVLPNISANETYPGISSTLSVSAGVSSTVSSPGAVTGNEAFKTNAVTNPNRMVELTKSNAGGYVYFSVSGDNLSDYSGFSLYFQAYRLSDAAIDMNVEYSLDNSTWLPGAAVQKLISHNTHEQFVFNLPATLTDVDLFYIRIRPTNETSSGSEDLKVYFDNIQLKGNIAFELVCADDPAPIEASANCSASYTPVTPEVVGNCSDVTVTGAREDGLALNAPYPFGTTRIFWTGTYNGMEATCTTTVTVVDHTDPVVSCPTAPANGTLKCAGDIPPAFNTVAAFISAGGTATDVCGIASISHNDVRTDVNCANDFTLVRTYTITDTHGNSATCEQTFVVFDDVPPTFTVPANISVTCSADVPAADPDVITDESDNCSDAVTVTHVGDVISNQTCANQYVITRTYRATDACGNSTDHAQTITVNDNVAPQRISGMTLPGGTNINACYVDGNTLPVGVPSFASLNVAQYYADNCTGAVSIVPANPLPVISGNSAGWTVTYHFEVWDVCENKLINQSISYSGSSQDKPIISGCPLSTGLTVYTGANAAGCDATVNIGQFGLTVTSCGGTVNATDVTYRITIDGMVQTGSTFTLPVGAHSVSVVAIVNGIESDPCRFTLTVVDNTKPSIITCPAIQIQHAGANCQFVVPDWTGTVLATDNCGTTDLTISQSVAPGTVWTPGPHTINFTVKDKAGNEISCGPVTVVVRDATAPVIVTCAPAQSTSTLNANCQAAVPDFTGGIIATDNCSSTGAGTLQITQNPSVGTMVGVGNHKITITVKDAAGNTATCETWFNVTSNGVPDITQCTTPRTVYVDGTCQAAIPDLTRSIEYNTGCGATGPANVTQSPAAGTLVGTGAYTVRITVTNANGSDYCDVVVTVADNLPPAITCPEPVMEMSCDASAVHVTLEPPTATDNCGPAAVRFDRRSDDKLLTDAYPVGITTVWWIATDGSGNTSRCSTTVTISNVGYTLINYMFNADKALRNAETYPLAADETYLGVTSTMTPDAITLSETRQGGNSGTREQNPGAETTEKAFKQNIPDNPAFGLNSSRAPGDRFLKFTVENAGDYGSFQLYFQAAMLPNGTSQIDVLVSPDCNAPKDQWTKVGTTSLGKQNEWFDYVFDLPVSVNGDNNWCFMLDPVGDAVNPGSIQIKLDNIQVRALNRRPAITCNAENITVTSGAGECAANATVPDPVATDDCGMPVITATRSDGANLSLSAPFPVGTTTVIFTATDAGTLSATCTTYVTVVAAPLAVDDLYGSVHRPLPEDGNQSIGNILTNDRLCVSAGTLSGAHICNVTPSASNLSANVWIDATNGNVMIAPGAAIGTYAFQYTICVGDLQSTATVTVNVDYNLPVTGLYLMGHRNGKDVRLNWRTAAEINTSHFIVERSFDGVNFSLIPAGSRVGAAGNSNAQRNYYGDDLNVTNEIVYYRVKLYDKDGAFRTSNIVAIRYSDSRKLRVYPNPVVDFVTIEFPDNGKYQIEMFGVNGQLVKLMKDLEINSGMHSITIPRGNLAPGNYNIRISNTTTGKVDWVRIIIYSR